jgi:hypothetical protein
MRTIPLGTMMKDEQDKAVRAANRKAKAQKKKDDARIQRLYTARCSGIQINIMDIGKVFKVAEAGIVAGMDDATLGDVIFAYVNEIRQN